MGQVRNLGDQRGWAVLIAVAVLKPPLVALMKRNWIDTHKIPAAGGCVLVLNHISYLDPLNSAHLVYDAGRVPCYLAKSELFGNRLLGWFLRSAGQISVDRTSTDAGDAFGTAVQAVQDGKAMVIYPEGTLTRDPDGWPMRGKTGVARIALETGCPVIPIGQWGAQEILEAYEKWPHLFPRKTVHLKVGDPISLADLAARQHTAGVVEEATDRIMFAITQLVEELRGKTAPTARFNPRSFGIAETGNPDCKKKGS
jgi:1-acyl-sn-glycerol-3-phosphate acyltransferase